MFTRASKVILYLLTIIGLIASFIIANNKADAGLFFVGALITFISLFFFGILVELANNVMDIKEFMERIIDKSNELSATTSTSSVAKRKCPHCGTENNVSNSHCSNCSAKLIFNSSADLSSIPKIAGDLPKD